MKKKLTAEKLTADEIRRLDILSLFEEAQGNTHGWELVPEFRAGPSFRSGYGVIAKSQLRKFRERYIGLSPLQQFLRDGGMQPNAPNRLDLSKIQQIHTLAAQGASGREIARIVGVHRETVLAYTGPLDRSAGLRRHHARRKAEGRPILPPWQLKRKNG